MKERVIKVVYMGTPDFAVEPLREINSNRCFEICTVITQKDRQRHRRKILPCPVKAEALKLGLPIHETDDVNSEDTIEKINSYNPDYIIVVAFGQIIKGALLSKYKDRILNLHASILPEYRGASPINRVLIDGRDRSGVSIMLVAPGLDKGDVLKICDLEIEPKDDYISLSKKLSELGAKCLVDTILNYGTLYEHRMIQSDELSSYTGLITKEMGHIDWTMKSEKIVNLGRGLSLWPKLFFLYGDQIVKLHEFDTIEKYNDCEVGRIFRADASGIYVNCADRCIVMKQIQFPGKKSTLVSDYIRGNKIEKITLG